MILIAASELEEIKLDWSDSVVAIDVPHTRSEPRGPDSRLLIDGKKTYTMYCCLLHVQGIENGKNIFLM